MKYDPTIERKECAVCGAKCQQSEDEYCRNCGAKIEKSSSVQATSSGQVFSGLNITGPVIVEGGRGMYIHEAIAAALEEGKCITRITGPFAGCNKIKPTNTEECCLVISPECGNQAERHTPRWNPKADDLLRPIWKVTE